MPASRKWILLINALLVVAVYIFAGAMHSGNGIIIDLSEHLYKDCIFDQIQTQITL